MTPSTDILSRQSLVLNRNWQPIHLTTVVRALVMLWNDNARVVDPEDYRLLSWEQWLDLPVREGMPCIRTGRTRLRARGRGPGGLRSAAAVGGHVQPAERRQARPLHLSVLRRSARGRCLDHRPCHSALARGPVDLDQLRRRLRGVQCKKGRPDARPGRHAAPQAACPPRLEAALRPERIGTRNGPLAFELDRFLPDEPARVLA